MMKISSALLSLGASVLLLACKPTVPSRYLQPDDMEDILFDYHLANAMVSEEGGEEQGYNERLYKLAVLKKYGVSEAVFDSSLVYYYRHADRLHDIYAHISERMNSEAVALGASGGSVRYVAGQPGQMADIWNGQRSILLMPIEPFCYSSFSMKADTSFYKKDRVIFSFDSRFLYQDGNRMGIAQLVMRLKNDSIVSRVVHISGNNHYSLEVADMNGHGVKELNGFVTVLRDSRSTSTTLRIFVAENIRLVRVHEVDTTTQNVVPDSVGRERINKDSVMLPEEDTLVSEPSNSEGKTEKPLRMRPRDLDRPKERPLTR